MLRRPLVGAVTDDLHNRFRSVHADCTISLVGIGVC